MTFNTFFTIIVSSSYELYITRTERNGELTMATVKSNNEEFLNKIKALENLKPKVKVSTLMAEYGIDRFITNICRTNKSGLAYHLIRNYGKYLNQKQLRKAVIALWFCPGGPMCKWVLYACRDAKEVLGDHFDSIVQRTVKQERVELGACLILDCDLSEEQKDKVVEMVGLKALKSHTNWIRRLLRESSPLSKCQKETLQSLWEGEVAMAS
ncbi:MAG: hypothetical protein WDZ80_05720 [Candidatus Paceibacterota bacterium]